MVKLKLVPILVIGVSLLIASSAFAYYHYMIQKNDKKIVESLKVTPTPTIIPTLSSSPSASPTPTIKYIQYPTFTPTPDIKQVLNDYNACKKACPIVGEGVTCTENSDNTAQPPTTDCHTVEGPGGVKTTNCTSSSGSSNNKTTCQDNRHPDETCINSCKGKYGLNF
jgi:hypothetical protein